MFNLEKREKVVIIFLLTLLLSGLALKFHQKSSVNVSVKRSDFNAGEHVKKACSKININKASAEDFKSIKGVGDMLAARIVEYRMKNGHFTSIEELKKVKGIGGKLFGRIKDSVTI